MVVMGLDIGSSSIKAVSFDELGEPVRVAEREYATLCVGPNQYEIDPDAVWACAQAAIREAAAGLEVGAICAASFGEAAIPVDARGEALYNNIMYTDIRGQSMRERLRGRLDDGRLYEITGAPPHGMYSLYKIMWLKENRPEVYRRAAGFHHFADYILMKLGARPHMDLTLGARTQAMDLRRGRWSPEVLEAAGVEAAKMPELAPSGTAVGRVRPALADSLGISQNALLVAGGHDQPCAALGVGAVDAGLAADGMGSVECIVPVFNRPLVNEAMRNSGFACAPHVLPGLYVTYAFNLSAGALFKWYRSTVEPGADYASLIEAMAEDAQGLMLLPHFAGAATPHMDPLARGALFGLTLQHGRPHLMRALLEGITYEMIVNLERLKQAGFVIERLMATGGLSRSGRLLKMKADMMGLPVEAVSMEQAGARGASLLAGGALGLFDPAQAAASTRRVASRFEPDAAEHAKYAERMNTYRKLYALAAQARM
jgi:xylulokinase